jgi:hypothetical protein
LRHQSGRDACKRVDFPLAVRHVAFVLVVHKGAQVGGRGLKQLGTVNLQGQACRASSEAETGCSGCQRCTKVPRILLICLALQSDDLCRCVSLASSVTALRQARPVERMILQKTR